jgi:hypothetical protein
MRPTPEPMLPMWQVDRIRLNMAAVGSRVRFVAGLAPDSKASHPAVRVGEEGPQAPVGRPGMVRPGRPGEEPGDIGGAHAELGAEPVVLPELHGLWPPA